MRWRCKTLLGLSVASGFHVSVPPTIPIGSRQRTVRPSCRRRAATARKISPLGSMTTAGPNQAVFSGAARFGMTRPLVLPVRGGATVIR
ncbi:Uncharacterised protein [Mycobacterium tuberculosis]|nr:Uncharacterised protein [Mycobacterium tuberculosis]